mgnify:CR=1 FL=1
MGEGKLARGFARMLKDVLTGGSAYYIKLDKLRLPEIDEDLNFRSVERITYADRITVRGVAYWIETEEYDITAVEVYATNYTVAVFEEPIHKPAYDILKFTIDIDCMYEYVPTPEAPSAD